MVFLYSIRSATEFYFVFLYVEILWFVLRLSLPLSIFNRVEYCVLFFDLHSLDINTDYCDYHHFLPRLLIFLFYSSLRDWPAEPHRPYELLLDHNARFEFITVL